MTRLVRTPGITLIAVFLAAAWLALPGRVFAAAPDVDTPKLEEAPAGAVVCPPSAYVKESQGCAPLGPDRYVRQLNELGIQLPLRPLGAQSPSADWSYVPFQYAQVVSDNAPIYASLDDAVNGRKPALRLESGFDYISYADIAIVDGHKYFQLRSGQWMYGGDLSRTAPPLFQGLAFGKAPERSFAWILQPTETRRTPGYDQSELTGIHYNRYDVVQLYATAQIDDLEWYLIGPEEWIEQRQVAQVQPRRAAPEGVDNGRWIEVNLFEQTVAVYENEQLVYATLTSSGLPGWWTRPGLFQIYIKLEADTMRGAFEPDRSDFYYLQDVPWTMYFDESRALHGAYWHNGFGYPRSHGCVNLAPGDANWIFNWAREGDWVYVWDPSGRTPVEEGVYGSGGA